MKLVDRIEVETNRGVVRLKVGDLPDPLVITMSPDYARSFADEIREAAGVADLDNEEQRVEPSESERSDG